MQTTAPTPFLSRFFGLTMYTALSFHGTGSIPNPVKVSGDPEMAARAPVDLAKVVGGGSVNEASQTPRHPLAGSSGAASVTRGLSFLYHDSEAALERAVASILRPEWQDSQMGVVESWSLPSGADRHQVARILVDLTRSQRHCPTQKTEFSGTPLIAYRDDRSVETVIARHETERNRSREAYLRSPQYFAEHDRLKRKQERRNQLRQMAHELVSGPRWDPATPKGTSDMTPYILQALVEREYPDGFTNDRFLYEVKDPERAEVIRKGVISDGYGSSFVSDVNRLVLTVNVAMQNGYELSPEVLAAVVAIGFDGMSGHSFREAFNIIRITWVRGEEFYSSAQKARV